MDVRDVTINATNGTDLRRRSAKVLKNMQFPKHSNTKNTLSCTTPNSLSLVKKHASSSYWSKLKKYPPSSSTHLYGQEMKYMFWLCLSPACPFITITNMMIPPPLPPSLEYLFHQEFPYLLVLYCVFIPSRFQFYKKQGQVCKKKMTSTNQWYYAI